MADPFINATNDALVWLARDGAQRGDDIYNRVAAHGIDGPEWLERVAELEVIEKLHGSGPTDPASRWAISPRLALEYAAAHSALRRGLRPVPPAGRCEKSASGGGHPSPLAF
jgi:hypothetical protein